MKHNLRIEVKQQGIAVERFLRVTRHRGFRLASLNIQNQADCYMVSMQVESERPIYLLTQQLQKLVEVNNVELFDAQASQVAN